METKFTRTYIEELGHKIKSGTITPEEQTDFDTWYKLQAEKELILPHDFVEHSDKLKERIYNRVWQKLDEQKNHTVPARTITWRRFAVAASLLLVIGIGAYFLLSNKQPKQEIAGLNEVILPGVNKATLTLANGTKISLADAENGQIATQAGIRINKTTNGQLVYEITESGKNAAVEYNTIEAPVGGQWQLILPDKSKVWLNALSSITYPTRFTGKERKVSISGEAYFEISHNKYKPFKVLSKDQTIEVLGTHFNVMAYSDEQLIRTTLLEGAVKVSDHGLTELLKPGQQAQVSETGIQVITGVDTEDIVAWKNGYFKFEEVDIYSVMRQLSRWYDVDVKFSPSMPKVNFSGKIKRSDSFQKVLSQLSYFGFDFKLNGRTVTVSNNNKP